EGGWGAIAARGLQTYVAKRYTLLIDDVLVVQRRVRQHARREFVVGADQRDFVGQDVGDFVEHDVLLDLALAFRSKVRLDAAFVGLQAVVRRAFVARRVGGGIRGRHIFRRAGVDLGLVDVGVLCRRPGLIGIGAGLRAGLRCRRTSLCICGNVGIDRNARDLAISRFLAAWFRRGNRFLRRR